MSKKKYKNIKDGQFFNDPEIGTIRKDHLEFCSLIEPNEKGRYEGHGLDDVILYEDPDERFELVQKPKHIIYKELVEGWIEASEERMEKAVEIENYTEATIQQNYSGGMRQALLLFEQIYGGQ